MAERGFRGKPYRRLGVDEIKQLENEQWKVVDLSHRFLKENIGAVAAYFKGVIHLNISHNGLGQGDLSFLGGLTQLKSLDLSMNDVGVQGIHHLSKLSGLEKLNVQRCRLESECVSAIASYCPGLRVLQLGYNRLTRKQPLCDMAKLQHLEVLGLEQCQLNFECVMEGLRSLPSGIQELCLRSNNLSGECLANIVISLKELRRLYLAFNFVRDNGATLICFHCPLLQELELSYCHLTDLSGMEIAKHLPKLKKLNLSSNKCTTATFNNLLENLKDLQFLSMNNNPINNLDILLNGEPLKLKKLQLEFHCLTNKEEKKGDPIKLLQELVGRIKVAVRRSGCELAITMP